MLNEELLSLTFAAAKTIVTAAAGDGWDGVKRSFARLLGRGNQQAVETSARRLEETRAELAAGPGTDLEGVRGRLTAAWQTRLSDLLEEAPGLAAELRVLVGWFQGGPVSASGTGMAAGRDIAITAYAGGVAAGTIAGDFRPGNPTRPGPAS
jgi:hypothetical protein